MISAGLRAGPVHRRGERDQPGAGQQPEQAQQQGEPAADAVRGELPYAWCRHLGYVGGDLRVSCVDMGGPPFFCEATPA